VIGDDEQHPLADVLDHPAERIRVCEEERAITSAGKRSALTALERLVRPGHGRIEYTE
jgi:hypothetical protein